MNLDSLLDGNVKSDSGLKITSEVKELLHETGKWTRFLAILGFIGVGLMALGGLFSMITFASFSSEFGSMGPALLISVFYLLFAALYFYPIYKLYQFGSKIRIAVEREDQNAMHIAFSSLKSHYKFIGILTLVMVGLYVLMMVGMVFLGAGRMMF